MCGVVLECGCEYYGSSVDTAGGRGSVEKINSRVTQPFPAGGLGAL